MVSIWKQWKDSGLRLCYSSFKHSVRPLISKAHYAVHKAIKRGELLPATDFDCVDCDQPAAVYDHRDYTKPP